MQTSYDIINTLIRTEKGTRLETTGKYLFHVATTANKMQIKKAVEEIYSVKVVDVNTQMVVGKLKRVRKDYGYTTPWKKAVVTLKAGSTIQTS